MIIIGSGSAKNERELKGKSLIAYAKDFTVIDIETTGYLSFVDEIIELSAIRVRNGEPGEVFSSLVKPDVIIDSFMERKQELQMKWLKMKREFKKNLILR